MGKPVFFQITVVAFLAAGTVFAAAMEHPAIPGVSFPVDFYGFNNQVSDQGVVGSSTIDSFTDEQRDCEKKQSDEISKALKGEHYKSYFKKNALVQIDLNDWGTSLHIGQALNDVPKTCEITQNHIYVRPRIIEKEDGRSSTGVTHYSRMCSPVYADTIKQTLESHLPTAPVRNSNVQSTGQLDKGGSVGPDGNSADFGSPGMPASDKAEVPTTVKTLPDDQPPN